ncbi:MAG: V-type ATP synthase subunit A [Clostridia bacterium]|nr:V-type ATP synthase subunit A [Clostridia bacterium]
MKGKVIKVSGPLIVAKDMKDAKMFDVVKIGEFGLIGEIIELRDDEASIQVYEDTYGIGPGDYVYSTNEPLSVELAPGLLGNIYDGIQRPLDRIYDGYGDRISRGINVSNLDRTKKWDFKSTVKVGDKVCSGDEIGTVQENPTFTHKILIPYGVSGTVEKIYSGKFTIEETIAVIKTENGKMIDVQMLQKWPVRKGRPYKQKMICSEPMVTGQRVIDTLFPIAKGGVAAVPGPFGSGKTVVQHQLAKWSDVDVIVYIGCGERGNEMTDVLNEFPKLIDPSTNEPLMQRTLLIANTSDMPVAAREASIYTGITIAEYFRDMGYNVALMADSTSRWAEALREMSGRLEEMPGEEGYPAYLSSRLAEFYERAGVVEILGSKTGKTGSVTAIGAVSPPGGDLSEPVSQATMRIVKVFLGLSYSLAYKRHFPAIDWLMSYSLYIEKLENWYKRNISKDFNIKRQFISKILQEENRLLEIIRLVGADSISATDQITMQTAKIIREDFLHQNAFNEIDTYTSMKKQDKILSLIYTFDTSSRNALSQGFSINEILSNPVKEQISKAKLISEDSLQEFDSIENAITNSLKR